MQAEDIRVFIPSKDYQESRNFYKTIGFELCEVNDELTIFESGNSTFFLQRYYNEEFAKNLMLQLIVTDIKDVFNHLQSIDSISIKFQPIKNEPWGKVIYLWGPSGELWHITELHSK